MWHVLLIGALMSTLCWFGPSVLDWAATSDGLSASHGAASTHGTAAAPSETEAGAGKDCGETTDVPVEVETAEPPVTAEPTDEATAPGDEPDAAETAKSTAETTTCAAKKKGDVDTSAKAGSARKYSLQPNPLAGCTLCHVDVEDEFVGSKHFDEKVGCKTCHGPSEGHLADENNEIKPDEVFARKDVERLCSQCHECWRDIPDGWAKQPRDKRQVCTECHGWHELTVKRPKESSQSGN
jgi:hypothetical protein